MSWIDNSSGNRLEWSIKNQIGAEYFGDYERAAGADEMEGLLWTASCMRDRRIISIRFETDWSDLVDMTTNLED